ncbi:hypothetical protein C8Q80DRAFT_699598 [Daedaleopsis nitida]|nr:hypothetical protein C8Q80DRAFT_699598 [Daedaleopsis nitida]
MISRNTSSRIVRHIGTRAIDEIPQALTSICHGLRNCPSVVELTLSENALRAGTVVQPLVPLLTHHKSLQVTKLHGLLSRGRRDRRQSVDRVGQAEPRGRRPVQPARPLYAAVIGLRMARRRSGASSSPVTRTSGRSSSLTTASARPASQRQHGACSVPTCVTSASAIPLPWRRSRRTRCPHGVAGTMPLTL